MELLLISIFHLYIGLFLLGSVYILKLLTFANIFVSVIGSKNADKSQEGLLLAISDAAWTSLLPFLQVHTNVCA